MSTEHGFKPVVSADKLKKRPDGAAWPHGSSPMGSGHVASGGASQGARHAGAQGVYGASSAGAGAAGIYGETLVRRKHKKRKVPKAVAIALAAVLAVIAGCGIALAVWVGSLGASMGFEDEEEAAKLASRLAPAPAPDAEDESFYALILGSDARGDEVSRSDVTMLVRVDPATAQVTLVSIPRDTMVEIEGQGTQKINAAYAFDGPAGAVDVVSTFAGVPISHYAEVHFEELEKLIDDLGGVWVTIPEGFTTDGDVTFEAGEQRLTGEQALIFARERHNVSGGDFSRAQAQRIIVTAVIKQVLAAPPAEMVSLVGKVAGCLSTDLGMGDLVSLAQRFQGVGAPTLYSTACPSYSLNVDGVSYVCPMFDEWRVMMQRVDAGLDPNDENAAIPEEQQNNPDLGAAPNSPAPRDYEEYVAEAGLTTDDVVPEVTE